jgi:hypothetical protein
MALAQTSNSSTLVGAYIPVGKSAVLKALIVQEYLILERPFFDG